MQCTTSLKAGMSDRVLLRFPHLSFIRLEPYPARYARHLPHAGKAFRFFPEPSSWAVDNSLCEIIFARKEEEWVEGSPRKAATFDGDTENILAWFIFYRQLLYPAMRKADLTIFLHQRMDFIPKDRKTGSQKVKRDFVKKVRYCIIFPEKKQGRTIIQNARWWGGDNLSIKRLYFESTLRLAFFRA